MERDPSAESLWVFGYGSLIWRPSFDYRRKLVGCIKGWSRRFVQGSTDHRGVPGRPGRVVTLVPSDGTTWGVCYEVEPHKIEETLAYLDHREKGGYVRAEVDFFVKEDDTVPYLRKVLVYYADETNPDYLGDAPEHEIAKTIVHSVGPSGRNIDYLLELAKALRELNIHDEYIFRLEEVVLALAAQAGTVQ